MKKIILLLILFPVKLISQPALKYNQNISLTYPEIINAYTILAEKFPDRTSFTLEGKGDNGRNIYTFVIEAENPDRAATVLINNGIHAGEPDGIDASIEFAAGILNGKLSYPNTRIVIIPVYNVDGNAVQSCCTRANQNGPLNQGFRANSRNLDLNRDFIKADAENTRTFYRIFQKYQPHVFIDNHVSNGADYQYTMTLISSQADKLGKTLGSFLRTEFEPFLYSDMEIKGLPLVPYVNTFSETPDSGLAGFLETPRFATGYAALFHCIGFVPETHMLKPYPNRVIATLELMKSMAAFTDRNATKIVRLKLEAQKQDIQRKVFAVNWKLDQHQREMIPFRGYEAGHKPSEISGLPRLYYDRNKPYIKKIPYLNHFLGVDSVQAPLQFVIPQAWHEVIERLELNGVKMSRLKSDTTIILDATFIKTFKTRDNPYEGHYLHYGTETIVKKNFEMQFFKGDIVINTNQPAVRFLMETLTPGAADSYFNWNFFDSMLQQKEYFSDYVFEDSGAELLKTHPELKAELEKRRSEDPAFSADGAAQLNFIYENSPYHEKTVRLYPVFKIYSGQLVSE